MCTIGKWTDPLTFEEKLTVLLVMHSGVTAGEVEVPAKEEGTDKIFVTYSWSDTFVKMKKKFEKDIAKGIVSESHPEVMAIMESLKKYRTNLDDIPISKIEIKLPMKVQTSPNSYDHDVVINKLAGGNHLVTLRIRLTTFSTMYIVKNHKKKMKFDFN